mgnify:CR=1 FL=1
MPTPPSPIAFVDLKAQQALIRDRIDARFKAILDHGAYINGPEHYYASADRLAGYQAELAAAGIGMEPTLVAEGDWSSESSRRIPWSGRSIESRLPSTTRTWTFSVGIAPRNSSATRSS